MLHLTKVADTLGFVCFSTSNSFSQIERASSMVSLFSWLFEGDMT